MVSISGLAVSEKRTDVALWCSFEHTSSITWWPALNNALSAAVPVQRKNRQSAFVVGSRRHEASPSVRSSAMNACLGRRVSKESTLERMVLELSLIHI